MIGIQGSEAANYIIAPQGHFFRLPGGNLQGAKLGNITDIPSVLRLVFDRPRAPTARTGLFQRIFRFQDLGNSKVAL